MNASRCEEEITPVKESIDFPSVESDDAPHEMEEYL